MSSEIEEFSKRLAEVEKAVSKLKEQDLAIARMIAKKVCMSRYTTGILFQEGEGLESYTKFWKSKLDATHDRIEVSQTIESVFDELYEFEKELADYIRAEKVDTADKAMEIAHSFIKKYSPVALPLKAVKEGDVWLVDIDVGALAVKIAKVKVDARTGDILSYEIPTKESKKAK